MRVDFRGFREFCAVTALVFWCFATFCCLPSYRWLDRLTSLRECFDNQSRIEGAIETYTLEWAKKVKVLDEATRRELLEAGHLRDRTAWPDDPGEGTGTGDHYVIVSRPPGDATTTSHTEVACVRHGFRQSPGPSARQQFVAAGVTSPDLLSRCSTEPTTMMTSHEPLGWLARPYVGPPLLAVLLGLPFLVLRRRDRV